MTEILFKREAICKRFDISKEVFYRLSRLPGSPIKKVLDVWVCSVGEMDEFVRQLPLEQPLDKRGRR